MKSFLLIYTHTCGFENFGQQTCPVELVACVLFLHSFCIIKSITLFSLIYKWPQLDLRVVLRILKDLLSAKNNSVMTTILCVKSHSERKHLWPFSSTFSDVQRENQTQNTCLGKSEPRLPN